MALVQLPPGFAWTYHDDPEDPHVALWFGKEFLGTVRWDDSRGEFAVVAILNRQFFVEFYSTANAAIDGLANEALSRVPWVD
ncbi:hypothetical protein [Lysobacter sp. CFH 32150]|uniref:hypothetical protein n=1 Tax=Lysobacter sp. CFH 32150 TaxID=2927128 RepID=UPI001FA6DC01|nr:hypothetical protein [Lysobacter sp. CFH 32150]MCI4567211.1 hypothetical protein [Lysobacter sp. CFH 32150]